MDKYSLYQLTCLSQDGVGREGSEGYKQQCSCLRQQVQGVDANSSLIVGLLLRGGFHGAQERTASIYMLRSWALYILRFDDGSTPTALSC